MRYLTCPDCATPTVWPAWEEGHSATPPELHCQHCGRQWIGCVDVELASALLCGTVGERTGTDAEGEEW